MEARESQREIMRLAALEDLPQSESIASISTADETGDKPYLDLAIRNRIQGHSTVTSLESLASSIDIGDEADKKLKRTRNIIATIDKESQVKEQRTSFRGLFSVGDNSKHSPKKSRKDDDGRL